jgi:hypothetical protein
LRSARHRPRTRLVPVAWWRHCRVVVIIFLAFSIVTLQWQVQVQVLSVVCVWSHLHEVSAPVFSSASAPTSVIVSLRFRVTFLHLQATEQAFPLPFIIIQNTTV